MLNIRGRVILAGIYYLYAEYELPFKYSGSSDAIYEHLQQHSDHFSSSFCFVSVKITVSECLAHKRDRWMAACGFAFQNTRD